LGGPVEQYIDIISAFEYFDVQDFIENFLAQANLMTPTGEKEEEQEEEEEDVVVTSSIVAQKPEVVEQKPVAVIEQKPVAIEQKPIAVIEQKPIAVQVSSQISQLAKQIAEIFGGEQAKYYEICETMKTFKLDDIVEAYMVIQDEEDKQEAIKKVEESETRGCEEKMTVEVKKTVIVEEKQPIVEIKPKELKMDYQANVRAKAQKVQEVLGGDMADYFGICYTYFFCSVNDMVEKIINDPTELIKNSSYKN